MHGERVVIAACTVTAVRSVHPCRAVLELREKCARCNIAQLPFVVICVIELVKTLCARLLALRVHSDAMFETRWEENAACCKSGRRHST